MIIFLHKFIFLYFLFIAAVSFIITTIAMPSVLHVARFRHLYDEFEHSRKGHAIGIPRLGGVAIFVGFTITTLLFCLTDKSLPTNYLICACILLFAIGLKDDLSGVNPGTKFFVQFIVCGILVFLGNVRLTNVYGIFGIYDLPYLASVGISILIILLVVNAFNLIDGIDGLAATTGIIVNVTLGAFFVYLSQFELAAVSFAMAGAMIGFLRFNITPAKIFMGDTGSLLIGLISVVMALKFLEVNNSLKVEKQIFSAPALTLAILIGPVFDTVRIFVLRIINRVSPFVADRNHIHHRMLKLGFNHIQSTIILTGINIVSILLVLMFRSFGDTVLIILIIGTALFFNWTVFFVIRAKERESLASKNLLV